MTWVAQLMNEMSNVYYVRYAPVNQQPRYFFLLLDKNKEIAFKATVAGTEPFDLKDFGEIIDSGYGNEAPQQVKEWVYRWYADNDGAHGGT